MSSRSASFSIANVTILFTHEDTINPKGCRLIILEHFLSEDAKILKGDANYSGCRIYYASRITKV